MRTIAALLAAFPLVAAAQTAPPQSSWTNEPAAPAAAPPQPAPPPAAQPPPAPPAQPAYAPPPQAAPPAPQYTPPPQQFVISPPKTRDRWYIGFGFGGGDGKVKNSQGTFDFRDLHGTSPTNVFFNFKVGATITPKLLLGLDIGGISSASDSGGYTSALAVVNVNAAATFFPTGRGFFLKGGLGRAAASYSYEDPFGKVDGSASGFDLAGGIGYAWWIGKQFNLTANLDFSRQWYGASSDMNIDDSSFWSLWLGFDWY